MKPYIVITKYTPQKLPPDKWNGSYGWRCWKIGEDICQITKEFGLIPLNDPIHGPQTWTPWYNIKLHAEVKKFTPKHPKGAQWHTDGDLDPGSKTNCALVLWSSSTPTEIQFKNKIYQPEPFEVILVRNITHRRPANAPNQRFIFRQRVEVPSGISI